MPTHKPIQSVGIITKRHNEQHKKLLDSIVRHLKKYKKEVFFDTNTAPHFKNAEGYKKEQLLKKVDMAIVMGGDGTLLKTARRLSRKKVLILGVNLGNLGFLTESTAEKILENLDRVFEGNYKVDRRSVLRVTIYRGGVKIESQLALNEAVINQGAFARLIKMGLAVDGRKMVNFKGDGLIVATPTGSTAHSLSAGGPIVHPAITGLMITPICPSSLSMRPILIPDTRQLTVSIDTNRREESANISLTIDGQDMLALKYGDQIKVRRSKRDFYLIRIQNRYYRTLRSKLNWGS